ncbi:MAG: hypothetical protein WBD74_01225 [Candidatus Aquilonibacter sp.]
MSLVAPYEHRQRLAAWVFVLMACVVVLEIVILVLVPAATRPIVVPELAIVICILIVVTWMSSIMQTRVDAHGVWWSLAWGWPGGHLPFAQIASVALTKLNWLERSSSGFTLTMWHGWLWHAAGSHAVEIWKTDGSLITLGTDDPQGLFQAIERFRKGAP